MDFKIEEKVYSPEMIKNKIQTLKEIFMASSLEKIFMTIKQCLNRNMKISKINEVYIFAKKGIETVLSCYQFSSRTYRSSWKSSSQRNLLSHSKNRRNRSWLQRQVIGT